MECGRCASLSLSLSLSLPPSLSACICTCVPTCHYIHTCFHMILIEALYLLSAGTYVEHYIKYLYTLYSHAPSTSLHSLYSCVLCSHAPSTSLHSLYSCVLCSHAPSTSLHPLYSCVLCSHVPSTSLHPLYSCVLYSHAPSTSLHSLYSCVLCSHVPSTSLHSLYSCVLCTYLQSSVLEQDSLLYQTVHCCPVKSVIFPFQMTSSNVLYSASYDGSIRRLDLVKEVFDEVNHTNSKHKNSWCALIPTYSEISLI